MAHWHMVCVFVFVVLTHIPDLLIAIGESNLAIPRLKTFDSCFPMLVEVPKFDGAIGQRQLVALVSGGRSIRFDQFYFYPGRFGLRLTNRDGFGFGRSLLARSHFILQRRPFALPPALF